MVPKGVLFVSYVNIFLLRLKRLRSDARSRCFAKKNEFEEVRGVLKCSLQASTSREPRGVFISCEKFSEDLDNYNTQIDEQNPLASSRARCRGKR